MHKAPFCATLFVIAISFISLSQATLISGTARLPLQQLIAVKLTGEPASNPKHTFECQRQYHRLLGSIIQVQYAINTDTNMQAATASYQGVSTELHPMGMAKAYNFISSGVIAPPNLNQIVFDMNLQATQQIAHLLFTDQCNINFKCLLSSQ